MTCAHCCWACTKKGIQQDRGVTDMDERTLRAAIDYMAQISTGYGYIIGGGEPTLHPQFWQFVGILLGASRRLTDDEFMVPYIVTNGADTEAALSLAHLARNGILSVSLSRDNWHDPIDERVVRAFPDSDAYPGNLCRSEHSDYRNIIRMTADRVRPAGRGRAAKFSASLFRDSCGCAGPIILPNGDIYACGCLQRQLGTVWAPEDWDWCADEGFCSLLESKKSRTVGSELCVP